MNNKQLDSYSVLISSKYFETSEDFINLICVNSKFKETTEKLRFNPIPIKSIKLFPNIQTQYFYSKDDVKIKGIDNYEIWYNVDYDQCLKFKQKNIKCHYRVYTKENSEKYGEKIPPEVNIVGDYCFSNRMRISPCRLKTITIPSTIKLLGNGCFSLCESLTSINLPTTITSLGFRCFWNCSSLSEINLPPALQTIGFYCFSKCSSLTSVDIPSTIISFGGGCFYGCNQLKGKINVPDKCFS